MKLTETVGYGVILYALMHLIVTLLGPITAVYSHMFAIEGSVLVFILYRLREALRVRTWWDTLPYAALWTIITMFLDGVRGSHVMTGGSPGSPEAWVFYLTILIAPCIFNYPAVTLARRVHITHPPQT